jgi:hypothetical protein
MEDSEEEEKYKCNGLGSVAQSSSSHMDVSDGSSAMQVRKILDFKKVQVVKMSAAGAMLAPWPQVLDEVVKRVSQIFMLASRFLNYYLARVFETPKQGGVRLVPPKSIFDLTFFEHIFKVVTGDAQVVFEPTLQFARCVWLHAMLMDTGATDLLPLNEAELRVEILATQAIKEAKKNAPPNKSIKKRKKGDVDDDEIECEEEEHIDEKMEQDDKEKAKQPSKKFKTGPSGQSAPASSSLSATRSSPLHTPTSIVKTILKHPALALLLPSCKQIDPVLKYSRKAYRATFQQYQITGLKAHITWYLMNKYKLTKATIQTWLLKNFSDWYGSKVEEEPDLKAKGGQPEQEEDRSAALAYLSTIERQDQAQSDDGILDDLIREQEGSMMQDNARLEWTRSAQEEEERKFKSLRGKRRNDLQMVELHHSILHALESTVATSLPMASTQGTTSTTITAPKRFSLAPFTKFTRRFVRFDTFALQCLSKHEIFKNADNASTYITSTNDIFNLKRLRSECKAGKRKTLSPTFTTDGVQVHLMWERILSLPCLVDPKKEAAYAAKQAKKAVDPNLTASGKVDGRTTRKKAPSILAHSDEPIHRKKAARLEDYDHGIFQESSILASRQQRESKGLPCEIRSLPWDIVAVDPGHTNVMCTSKWDPLKQDWIKWINLSKKEYYRGPGQQHVRHRTEKRLQSTELGKRVATHMEHMSVHSPKTTSVDECLAHLLYVRNCWEDMFAFYGSKNAARARFTTEQRRQRLMATLIESLVPEREKKTSIIVMGSATFPTSMKGTQATPVARLIKEIAKVRRVVLVNEYFTTQMCSGCNLQGLGERSSAQCDKARADGCTRYPLRSNSMLKRKDLSPSKKPNHLAHPTISMQSLYRTCETRAMRERRERIQGKAAKWILRPPDPGGPARPDVSMMAEEPHMSRASSYNPLSRPIHGLKQCVHCGRFWVRATTPIQPEVGFFGFISHSLCVCCTCVQNRDLNASRNIGWVFIGMYMCGARPPHLQRHGQRSLHPDTSSSSSLTSQPRSKQRRTK